MSLINRLATQTSSGYKSFISLFKYKLLLMALLLLGASVNAGAVSVDKGTAPTGHTKQIIDIDEATVKLLTNEVTETKTSSAKKVTLSDALVSGLTSAGVMGATCTLYIGITKSSTATSCSAIDYSKASNPFEIDLDNVVDTSGKALIPVASGSIKASTLDSIEVYPKLDGGLKFSSAGQHGKSLTLTNGLNIHKGAVVDGLEFGASNFTANFDINNEGKITTPGFNLGTHDYKGSGVLTVSGISVAIASGNELIKVGTADFKYSGQLVLQTASSVSQTKALANLYILAAKSKIEGFSEDQLLCELSLNQAKDTGYIITGSASLTDKYIAVKNATATVLTGDALNYFPTDPIKLNDAAYHVTNAPKKAKIIEEASATEFAGIKLDTLLSIESNIKNALYEKVREVDADDIVDILMPDSSNSTLNASSKVTSKVFDHIGSRIASRNINFSHKKGVTAVNSGEVADNLSMWSSVGYAGSSQKKTDDNQDYSELSGFVFNIGLDTNLNNDMIIGGCYGFSNNTATIRGAHNKTEKAENKIMSHVFSGYGSVNFDHVMDANFAVMFGMSKNDYTEVGGGTNNDKYDSTMFGFNAGVVYPVEVKQHSIDVLGQIGIVNVNSKEHNNKYGKKTPKQANTLINLGLGSAFKDTTVVGDDMPLHYSLGVMMKLALTTGDEHSAIDFTATGAKTKAILKVKNRKADMFSINCNTGLSLQAHKNLDVNFDFDLGLGFAPLTVSYGIGAGLRYKF